MRIFVTLIKTEENSKFKEEIELKNCMEARMNQLNSDYEELKVMYVKQTKSNQLLRWDSFNVIFPRL